MAESEVAWSVDTSKPAFSGCETAFAFHMTSPGTCFLDYPELGANRWGWSIGKIGAGTYTYDIYAAAGQCDLTKGHNVGVLTVKYTAVAGNNKSYMDITYSMFQGYTMSEIHFFTGDTPLPVKKKGNVYEYTVAPGAYTVVDSFAAKATTSVQVTGLDGKSKYLVAHAVTCGSARLTVS
jgi:hypothetical protein